MRLSLEIFFKIFVGIVWILVENSMEIQFWYTNYNLHTMDIVIYYGFSDAKSQIP
jgi:hypothetical protein